MSEKLPRSREVVSRSWSIVSKHWRVLAKYLAPLLIVTIAADILLFRPEPGALALIIVLILIVDSVWMTIVLMRLVDQAARGRALDEAAARKNVPERILPWLGVSIVTGL
ncbi:hypothetical protein HYV72_01675, partial [Candidatus Uhrbacteria bacterium]|nr:hypothetical protein [Candidatus Uhrbacteria bacterium]